MTTATNTPSPLLDSEMLSKENSQTAIAEVEQLPFQDDTSKNSQLPSDGPRKSLGLAAVLTLAPVLFWSFGMGSALLIWLLVRRIPPIPGISTDVFDGFIVVDEGIKTGSTRMLDGQEGIESTMRGVLIITAISHFSSVAVFPLMSLRALHVASQWLDIQTRSKGGPTPLQFGLIVQMCSTGTWDSILVTLKYLVRRWKDEATTRTRVSPIVYRALGISIMVVFLHYAVVATDLWLTSEIGSVYYTRSSEVDISISTSAIASGLGTRHNTSVGAKEYAAAFYCSGYPLAGSITSREDEWSGDRSELIYRGLDTMYGQSTRNHISVVNTFDSSSLENTLPMAVIVRSPSGVLSQWSWTAPTIEMTTRCQPISREARKEDLIICPKPTRTYPSMPLPSFSYRPSHNRTKFNNAIGYSAITGEIISNKLTYDMALPQAQTNPTYVFIQLYLDGSSMPKSDPSQLGQIMLDSQSYLFYYGTCEVTMYDVEVAFTGSPSTGNNDRRKETDSQYRLISPPVPMSDDRMTLLFGPIIADSDYFLHSPLNRTVMNALERSVLTAMVKPGFSKVVSAEFARLCLSLISSMGEPIPAKSVTDNVAKLVSRYPMAGTLSYIAVVYAHGLLAVVLFIGIVRRTSNSVVVSEPGWQVDWRGVPVKKEQNPVAELLLVHSRLTDPLAVVAEHFLEPGLDEKGGNGDKLDGSPSSASMPAGTLSTRNNPIDIFGKETSTTTRVEVGIIEDGEGRRRFGLNHRRGRLVESLHKGDGA